MADDKTTKTPEQPVTDSGPGKETPPAPPKEPEKIYRKSTTNTGDKRNAENTQKHRGYAGFRRFLIPQPT